MSLTSHRSTTTALPLKADRIKCACTKTTITRFCLGCDKVFCTDCFKNHRDIYRRREEHAIDDSDLLVQIFAENSQRRSNGNSYNPAATRDDLKRLHLEVRQKIDQVFEHAFKELRGTLDARHDELISSVSPIVIDSMSSIKTVEDLKKDLLVHTKSIRKTLEEVEEDARSKKIATTVTIINRFTEIDLSKVVEIRQGLARRISTALPNRAITDRQKKSQKIALKYHNLTRKAQCRIEDMGDGQALAASDNLVIYFSNNNIIMFEPNAEYRVIIPMAQEHDVLPSVVDICWVSTCRIFLMITENYAYEINPQTKHLDLISHMTAPEDDSFVSCTAFENRLILAFQGDTSLYEWKGSSVHEWQEVKKWRLHVPGCDVSKANIRHVRFSNSGDRIGCALRKDKRSDLFIVCDSSKMELLFNVTVPARPCCGFICMPNDDWFFAVKQWHVLFRIAKDGSSVDPLSIGKPGEITIQRIALVGDTTVVMRTLRTVQLFNLLED